MLKFEQVKVKGYRFNSKINSNLLSDVILNTLGLKRESQYETFVEVEGSFIVSWDYDIPIIEIEDIALIGSQNGTVPTFNMVDITEDQYDIDSLCDIIADNGDVSDWAADRQAELDDYYYDMQGDR